MEHDHRILAQLMLPDHYFLPRQFTGDWEPACLTENTLPLYVAREGRVLTFCVIGTVRDIGLVDNDGSYLPNVYIDIEPLNRLDGKALAKLCKAAGYEEHGEN